MSDLDLTIDMKSLELRVKNIQQEPDNTKSINMLAGLQTEMVGIQLRVWDKIASSINNLTHELVGNGNMEGSIKYRVLQMEEEIEDLKKSEASRKADSKKLQWIVIGAVAVDLLGRYIIL